MTGPGALRVSAMSAIIKNDTPENVMVLLAMVKPSLIRLLIKWFV